MRCTVEISNRKGAIFAAPSTATLASAPSTEGRRGARAWRDVREITRTSDKPRLKGGLRDGKVHMLPRMQAGLLLNTQRHFDSGSQKDLRPAVGNSVLRETLLIHRSRSAPPSPFPGDSDSGGRRTSADASMAALRRALDSRTPRSARRRTKTQKFLQKRTHVRE